MRFVRSVPDGEDDYALRLYEPSFPWLEALRRHVVEPGALLVTRELFSEVMSIFWRKSVYVVHPEDEPVPWHLIPNVFAMRLEDAQNELFTRGEAEALLEWVTARPIDGPTLVSGVVLDASLEEVRELPYDLESFDFHQAVGDWHTESLSSDPSYTLPFDVAIDARGGWTY
ncbi:MAG: hypothetical protein M3O88_09785 [Actinomycetota bacterium]|nr:hypothetical protein [Actinomycetota bacterium]